MVSKLLKLLVSCTLLLASCFFVPLTLATGTGTPFLGSIDYAHRNASLSVLRGSPEYTSISLRSDNVTVEEKTVNFTPYKIFGIPGEPFVMEEGVPSVPQVSRFYRIPNTGSVQMVISNTDDYELLDSVDVWPYQEEGSDHFGEARSVAYDQNQWYPPSVAEMSEPMIMRDFRVVRVALYPVQVNPVTRQVRVYHNLEVELVANNTPGVNEITWSRPVTGSWIPTYRNMIENLDDSALDDATSLPGTYMIMSKGNSLAYEWADSLARWKKRKGLNVVIDTTHVSSASQMITAIQTAYAGPNPPEFVALIGDPSWSYGVPTDGGNYDHSFALGNSGDDLEDIAVGRMAGGNGAQMATINAKTMGYERTPWMENSQGQADTMWFHRGFFLASLNWNCGSNYTMQQWSAEQFRNNTGVDCTYVRYYQDGSPDPNNMICQYLQLGVSLCFIRPSWEFEIYAPSCSPSWKLPLAYVTTCLGYDASHGFVIAGTPTQPSGGVAAMGTQGAGTHAPENITIAGGISYGLADLGLKYYGQACSHSKLWLYLYWGSQYSGYPSSFARWNVYEGDPGLEVWTDVPKVMDNVDYPATVNVGTHYVAIDVAYSSSGASVEDALVVLWKGNEVYARAFTDAQGHVDIPVNVATAGDMLLTITKHNHKPFLATIPCVQVDQMVSYSSTIIDDDNSGGTQGNNNGQINPGEVIDLPMYLRNFGNFSTATNVSAVLTSTDPSVTVVSGSSNFSDIPPGDSVQAQTAFRISISPTMQHQQVAMMSLSITASSIPTTSAFNLACVAGEPVYVNHQFAGTVNPGTVNRLQVTVRNAGLINLNGASGELVSLSPFVQILDDHGTFGTIAPGQQATNNVDTFAVTSNSQTYRGHLAPMCLIMSTSDGFVDTTQFTVSIGTATTTDPTGPDTYGYFAYDNTDASYEMHPTYDYVDISAGLGENLNLSQDPGDPGAPNPPNPYSRVRGLPFPFEFYGQTYDTITVCSNGWAAFGNQAFLDLFRNYPIPAMQSPDAMLAPYWDDLRTNGSGMGVWKYDDAVNHRCIIQWKAGVFTSGPNLDFEIILYDETFDPTFDHNGKILFQYNVVTMGAPGDSDEPPGCDIGIQAPGCTVGLPYAFCTTYYPGAANVSHGTAILFTTAARMLMGSIAGTVRSAGDNQPLPNVDVTVDGYNYHSLTDASGQYTLDNVLIGNYTVRAHKRAYNDTTASGVLVVLDSTTTVNLSMLHPEFALSTDSIAVSIPEQPVNTSFQIQNAGNGPLEYSTVITYSGNESATPWAYLDGFNITQMTNDQNIQGCEFANDYWWVSGMGSDGPRLYQLDHTGQYLGSIPQPSSGIGWFDMAYDGQYLYGSEQGQTGRLVGIDLNGQVHDSIPCPVNPARALAYDPASQHFWVGDLSANIYEINRQGGIVQTIVNDSTAGHPRLMVTGMAWYPNEPDGHKLLMFCFNGTGTRTQLWKMMPTGNHDRQLITTLEANPGEISGGLTITSGYNSVLLVLGGILQGSSGDRLGVYQVTFNTTWLNVTPMQQIVPGGSNQTVNITFDPTNLRVDMYRVHLNIHSDVLDSTYVLPVTLNVTATGVSPSHDLVPTVYALYQNYPNPFNASTTLSYDLPNAGYVSLRVFDLLGREVAVLKEGMMEAGAHRVMFDGNNLASGIYFVRLDAGSFSQTRKLMLLK